MRKKKVDAIAIKSFALLVVLVTVYQAMAQDAKTPYPNMAPIEQYLMDRTAEVALARSAAPESISRDAEILVLGYHGFETAIKGKNGFVCIVERSWTSAPEWQLTQPRDSPARPFVRTVKASQLKGPGRKRRTLREENDAKKEA